MLFEITVPSEVSAAFFDNHYLVDDNLDHDLIDHDFDNVYNSARLQLLGRSGRDGARSSSLGGQHQRTFQQR